MNKYCNLDGYKKIKDDFQNINIGFDRVEEDVDKINNDVKNIDDRVDTIITTPVEGVSAQEIVDARKGEPTLGDKIQSMDDSLKFHKSETSKKHITESGTNNNGSYVKFDDGTLMCRKRITTSLDVDNAWGSIYSSSAINPSTYPASFLIGTTPNVVIRASLSGAGASVSTTGKGSPVQHMSIQLVRGTPASGQDAVVDILAVGRWKD